MIKVKPVSEVIGLRAYVEDGEYFGNVEGAIIDNNKVDAWRIKATKNSFLDDSLGGAKGALVPHSMVKAVGDVMIVRKAAAPSYTQESE